MCGIVSAISCRRNVVPHPIDGLKRLEYRGDDSAGIAVINDRLHRVRAPDRVADLESRIAAGGLSGGGGIGHTRWATHGEPSERNAHPHVSGGIPVVHNGIIENHDAIRRRLPGIGMHYPIAMEGALKLEEISYILADPDVALEQGAGVRRAAPRTAQPPHGAARRRTPIPPFLGKGGGGKVVPIRRAAPSRHAAPEKRSPDDCGR